ncbi:MAG: sigma factor-like helix-turn-helix DNA-binding protein, partial [Pirellulaceae bacterium]|nr:sigma factor-like helix-turn-helix DNA-binding protein [Pirellulaceae bacterium]
DEERKTLRCAIDKLPTAQREVITRRIDDQQPFQEIATSMRRSNVAARVLWVRAMKRLRRSVRTE